MWSYIETRALPVVHHPTACNLLDADEPVTPSEMHIPPPAYQQGATSFKLDLSGLSSNPQCQSDAITAIDSQAIQWPMAALRQATTLDNSQLRALQVCLLGAHLAFLCACADLSVTGQHVVIMAVTLSSCQGYW